MTFFRSLLFVCPAACVLAQTPPPAASPARPATPAPQPTVTLSRESPADVKMPVVPPDRVVLKVGDTSLTAAQFDMLIDALPEQVRASARGAGRKQMADNIVKVLVLAEEGKRRKLDQTPRFKTQSAFTADNLLAGAVFQEIGKEAKVDEPQARQYYDEHKQEFESVTARHILIRMQGAPVPVRPGQKDLSDQEALAKAQEIRKRIIGGEDFAALARAESDDAGSGANGGDLGSFGHGQMVPSFEAKAFEMKPGEISDPVKSQFGYHIIQVQSHQTKSFEEVRPDIERRLGPQQSAKILDNMVKQSAPVYDPEFFNAAKQ
jgi:peptidyl-prolyl cis-trans isomerase C